MTALLRGMFRRDEGQSLVEYVLIISLVAIILIASLNALTTGIVNLPLATVIAVL
jgi:Flp pilus assembly pilin Flp